MYQLKIGGKKGIIFGDQKKIQRNSDSNTLPV
jgi:hypothetical protein